MTAIFSCAAGCGSGSDKQTANVVQEDPVGEFERGMTRLKHALRISRPNGSDGVSISARKVTYQLNPPDDKTPHYTASITISSEASFLHAQRKAKEKEKAPAEKESEIDDPLADKDDDYTKYIDIPGAGPQAPAVPTPILESPTIENKSVFKMAYLNGHWMLTQTPEKKHEQLWFEYAFE
jgi:hypothetical protein